MPFEFKLQHRVEFAETDMAGIMHFSNYFRYMEVTEHAFVRSLGFVVHEQREGRMYGLARVKADCRYFEPLRYQDLVEVHLVVREKRRSSLGYDFIFRRIGDEGQALEAAIARGSLTVVCVTRGAADERLRAARIPEELARSIDVAPAGRLVELGCETEHQER